MSLQIEIDAIPICDLGIQASSQRFKHGMSHVLVARWLGMSETQQAVSSLASGLHSWSW